MAWLVKTRTKFRTISSWTVNLSFAETQLSELPLVTLNIEEGKAL